MQKERKDNQFIKKPIYPGGLKAMRQLINKELKYPEAALKNRKEGTVFLRYEIDYTGKVTSSKILSGIGFGCDEEAQRIVTMFKFEIPKNPRKLRIKFHKTINIHFRLPKVKEILTPSQDQPYTAVTNIQYTITKKNQKEEPMPKPEKKAYTFTINF